MIRIIKTLIFLVTLVISIATCVAYYSSYIQPDILNHLVLIQFAFPYLWLANAVLVVVDLIKGKYLKIIFPLLVAVFTLKGALSVFNIGRGEEFSQEAKRLKVLTYNIHFMSLSSLEAIGEFIQEQDADIVCLQEANYSTWVKLKPWTKAYKYASCHHKKAQLVIMSKFPLQEKNFEDGNPFDVFSQWVDVTIEKEKIQLINCHLASNKLDSAQIDMFDINHAQKDFPREEIKKQVDITVSKLLTAYQRRQAQVETLEKSLLSSDNKFLICGDFNDMAISYTYQVMKRVGLKDSFYEVGRGLGDTYNGKLPPIRIDYVWYSPDRIKALNYKEIKVPYSDHFPVLVNLELLP